MTEGKIMLTEVTEDLLNEVLSEGWVAGGDMWRFTPVADAGGGPENITEQEICWQGTSRCVVGSI